MHPDVALSACDHTLGEAMRTETEMFFNAFVKEDRDIRELITADFTYVNDRLAQHYGIPNVAGPNFRRVTLTDPNRRGLLGQGSILTLTSVADRTSPVQRGKWIMGVLLGTSPPPPPPDVPAFTDTKGEAEGRLLTVRERMEQHRKNPTCQSCHRVIDPIGLARKLDVTGKWRIRTPACPSIRSASVRLPISPGRRHAMRAGSFVRPCTSDQRSGVCGKFHADVAHDASLSASFSLCSI